MIDRKRKLGHDVKAKVATLYQLCDLAIDESPDLESDFSGVPGELKDYLIAAINILIENISESNITTIEQLIAEPEEKYQEASNKRRSKKEAA
jgi:hypothetical protein